MQISSGKVITIDMNRKLSSFIPGAAAALSAVCLAVFSYFYATLPVYISAEKNSPLQGSLSAANVRQTDTDSCAYFLGNIPIKYADVSFKDRPRVIPSGMPFGIKIRSEGVMVVSTADDSPAEKAGLRAGDLILSVNGDAVHTNAEISEKLNLCTEAASIVLKRGDSELSVELLPQNESGEKKIGAWVRDSAAGIGTLTFYEPNGGSFGGLGHAVSDATTGAAVPLGEGEITEAQVYGIVPSKEGTAGELCGLLLPSSDIGDVTANTSTGVFGKLREPLEGEAIPIAFKQEVRTGAATILTTVDGNEPQEYSIEIERINLLDLNGSKAMVIRITDSELLDLTGGIVRGMSGSPIIQNGHLVGAVTHVLVNDPTRGYAIFAETMLDNIDNIYSIDSLGE